jgi:hyperosmotically inducible protein
MKYILAVALLVSLTACRTNESPEAQIDDFQITAQVKAKLASDVGVSSVTNISVNSTNGVVTLAGQVDTADIKSKAVAVARAIPKVSRVVDNLQVTPKPTSGNRSSVPSRTLARGKRIACTSA